jgi:serine/threonine protein kinase
MKRKGTNRETGEEVAIKVIPCATIKKNKALMREVSVMKRCSHPNVIKFIESFRTLDNLYIIMELSKGPTLFDALCEGNGSFTESQSRHFMKQLFSAVNYLHNNG